MACHKTELLYCLSFLILAQVASSTIITWDPACGVTKGCFPNCPGGCQYLVTWQDTGTSVTFEAKAVNYKTERWMAVAFSEDYSMGDDSVVTCVYHGNGTMHVAYTEDTEYEHIEPEHFGITPVEIKDEGNILTCSFHRTRSESHAHYADLSKTKTWILMLAIGEAEEEDDGEIEIEHHHDIPKATADTVNFQLNEIVEAKKLNSPLVKLHSIMMIVAWILFSTTGIITARYNKEMLQKRTLFGNKIWFQVHRCCMVLVLICVVVGFVLIFIEIGGYAQLDPREEYDFTTLHPILGIIVTAIVILNPIGAILRCGPDNKLRWIFNWGHWALGISAHIIAVITIFFGFYLERANVPRTTVYVAIVYVAVVVIYVAVSELHKLRGKYGSESNKSTENGVSGHTGSFNMQEESQSSNPPMFPRVAFVITSLVSFAITIILVVIVIDN